MTVRYLKDADETATAPADAVNGEDRQSTREELGRYADQGGFTITPETNPWLEAADSVTGPEDARAASTVLAELRSLEIRAVGHAATGIAGKAGLDVPDSLAGLTTLLDLLQRVQATSATLRTDAYDADLDALTAATATGRWRKEQGVKLSWGRRRQLKAQARALTATTKRAGRADLHTALVAATAARGDWAALAADGADVKPVVPVDGALLTETGQAVDSLGSAVRSLGRLLPERALESLPLAELADLVDRLAADEGTLYRLSALRQLRSELAEQGLGDLLAELTERQADRDAALAAYDRHLPEADEDAARQALAAGPRVSADADADVAVAVDETEAEAEAEVEPVAEAEVEPVAEVGDLVEAAEAETEAVAEPAAEVEAEPAVEVEPVAEAEAAVELAEVEAAAETELAVEVAPVADVEAADAEAVAEPAAEIEVEAEPVAEVAVAAEVEPVAEPVVEPAVEVEPVAEVEAADAEAVAEAEPAVEVEVEAAEVEPVVEPAAEVEAEPVAEVAVAAEVEVEVDVEPVAEPAVEVEAVAEVAEAEAEPVAEAVAPVAGGRPEITPGRPVTAYEPAELVALVRWLDGDGVTRSDDELLRAAMKELGFARLGPRIKEALGAAVTEVRG